AAEGVVGPQHLVVAADPRLAAAETTEAPVDEDPPPPQLVVVLGLGAEATHEPVLQARVPLPVEAVAEQRERVGRRRHSRRTRRAMRAVVGAVAAARLRV